MPTWLSTVVTLAAGSILAILSGWMSNRWTVARDREARREARRDQLTFRRSDFQRENLLKLQDAAMRLTRATSAALHQDRLACRGTGQWQQQALGAELSETHRMAITEVMLVTSRIRDEFARTLADDLRARCVAVVKSENAEKAAECMDIAGVVHESLNMRIGEILRELDGVDDLRAIKSKYRGWSWNRTRRIDPTKIETDHE